MTEPLASPVAVAFTWMLLHFLWQGATIACCYRLLYAYLLYGQSTFVTVRPNPSDVQAVSMSACANEFGDWDVAAGREPSGLAVPDGLRRSASSRYAMSLTMLGVMAICPLVTFAWLYNPDSSTQQTALSLKSIESADAIASTARRPDTSSWLVALPPPAAETSSTAATQRAPDAVEFVGATLNFCQPYLLLLWGVGVILSGLRLAVGFANILWLRAGVKPIPDALQVKTLLLARKVGLRIVRVFASSRIHEAAVVGFWRPMVLLPAAWLTSLPPEVLQAVIAHELAHIRRLDAWVNLLQRLLETFFFYHPAVWWLSNRVRIEREMCCDELAVKSIGNRGQYAMALETIARMKL